VILDEHPGEQRGAHRRPDRSRLPRELALVGGVVAGEEREVAQVDEARDDVVAREPGFREQHVDGAECLLGLGADLLGHELSARRIEAALPGDEHPLADLERR
jgi:hypothetical protein